MSRGAFSASSCIAAWLDALPHARRCRNLHLLIAKATDSASGIRDLAALESAIAQPKATFDGKDLYSSLTEKAAVLCFSIVQGHPFVDGNKRTGHAAMATFLLLNGAEIDASIDQQEQIILKLKLGASGFPMRK